MKSGEPIAGLDDRQVARNAVLKFPRKLMIRYGRPREIVTDQLPSYGAALRDLGAGELQSSSRWLKNRAENFRLPMRRRERARLRFRRMRSLQAFAAVHSPVSNHFKQDRSFSSRSFFKLNRPAGLPVGFKSARPEILRSARN